MSSNFMSKLSIIIIEDEFFVSNHLRDIVESLGHNVKSVFHSGEAFMEYESKNYDLAFVDIQLAGELTGIDIAHQLNAINKPFTYITANNEQKTLKEAALSKPCGYISKPFSEMDINAAIEIMAAQIDNKIEVRTKEGVMEVDPKEVYYIKSDNVYIEIATLNGILTERKLLKDIERELPDYFTRVHRSYLVNKTLIQKKSPTNLVVNGQNIPLSRSFKDNV